MFQLGWFSEHQAAILPRVAAISACSAGAAMAVMLFSGREETTKGFFAEARKGVTGHVNLARWRTHGRPFPHESIYRESLHHALDQGGFERIKALPFAFDILCAALPSRPIYNSPVGIPAGIAVGMAVYQAEKRMRKEMLHPTYPRWAGFRLRSWDARDCRTPEELVDLVLASSATPPFTKVGNFRGEQLLDGSLIDNAPAFLCEERGVDHTLVLLTRPYPNAVLGRRGNRTYIAPQAQLPIARWDYRESAPVDETRAIGTTRAAADAALVTALLSF